MSTSALDAALAAIAPAVVPTPTAAKNHRTSYRQCVCLLAADNPIPPERHAEFTEAVHLLGITQEMLTADVCAIKEAARCQSLASQLDGLNQQARDIHTEMEAFEAEAKRQRAALVEKRTAVITQIQLATAAAAKAANIERDSPRLAG